MVPAFWIKSHETLQILVVEDDALLAMLLGELLAGMGHEVCATAATIVALLEITT
jgi:CheY-like chemotaxis protein